VKRGVELLELVCGKDFLPEAARRLAHICCAKATVSNAEDVAASTVIEA
jgi:hypothetical protein